MRRFHAVSTAVLLFSIGLSHVRAQDGPQPRLPTARLTAGMHALNVEVARTADQHMVGLMHRTSMPLDDGMLFVFEAPAQQCFWMRNTLLPLSVAFIDDDGRIVNIDDMVPKTLDSHCSTRPVRYVLEMNRGWFAKRGLKTGMTLRGAPFGT